MSKNEENLDSNGFKIENESDKTISKEEIYLECKFSKESDFSIVCQSINYEPFIKEITVTGESIEPVKIIDYPFDKYVIKIGLSSSNEFIGITEIKTKEDFRSYEEKINSEPFYDVNEYYSE